MANFDGTGANDTLTGGAENDSINGAGGNDSLAGDAGDDTISAGTGVDTVDGGAGTADRLVLLGTFDSDYQGALVDGTTIHITNAVTGEDITVSNVEYVQDSTGALKTVAQIRADIADSTTNQAPSFTQTHVGATVVPSPQDDLGSNVIVQADGSILVGGIGVIDSVGDEALQLLKFNADGTPDTTFGAGGRALDVIGTGFGMTSMSQQSDGKVIVVGNAYSASLGFVVARYNADGTRDATFGSGGVVTTDFTGDVATPRSAFVQPDGKIVVGGFTFNGATNYDLALARYNTDGSLDTSFGTGGKVVWVHPGHDIIRSAIVLDNGEIVAAGTSSNAGAGSAFLAMFHADGTFDTSFGTGGVATIPLAGTSNIGGGRTIVHTADGKFVIAGYEDSGRGTFSSFVARLNADGSADSTLNGDGNTDGKVNFAINAADNIPLKLLVLDDGKMLIAGVVGDDPTFATEHGYLTRLNADGTIDTTFGNGGVVWAPFPNTITEFGDIALDASGNIVVTGNVAAAGASEGDTYVLRLTSDGSIDSTFGGQDTLGTKSIAPDNGNPVDMFWGGAHIYDAELAAQNDYNGSTLTVHRQGGADANDVFGTDDQLAFSDGNVSIAGVNIGTVTNDSGTLTIHFNHNATQQWVDGVMNLITWSNASESAGATVQFDWTFDDGSGAGNSSVTSTSSIEVVSATEGTSGNDTLTGTDGDGVVYGGAGNDSLTGGSGDNLIFGEDGNDTLVGNTGNDTLVGNAGFDTFRPGAGDDSIDGGDITDRINYSDRNILTYANDGAGVNIDMSGITGDGSVGHGIARDGFGGIDTFTNINFIVGSNHDDTILGSSALIFEQFTGAAGNDTINGGALIDTLNNVDGNRISYQSASSSETVDLQAGTATGGEGNDTLINITQVRGSNFNDTLMGSDRTDYTEQFEGYGGNDSIDGRGGFDIVRYDNASGAVNVNLATGQATGAAGTDTLVGIEGVQGSNFADVLTGGNAANGTTNTTGLEVFRGGGGNDTIDGGQGYDRVDYNTATTGVNVTLGGTGTGTAQDGLGGTDTLFNIEAVRGSAFDDTLTGSDSAAFESFEGREGNDTIDGKGGIDRVDYNGSTSGVYVNLDDGTALDGWGGGDTLLNIEWARGSRDFGDTLIGNNGANRLEGQGGNDNIDGGLGNDSVVGGSGNDTVAGGGGDDWVAGNAGDDVLSGNDGFDWVDYSAAGAAVQVDLGAGTATGDGNDTLGTFEAARGSGFADSLKGTAGDDQFVGGAGNDTIDGAGGSHNQVEYWDVASSSGVNVNLVTNIATDGQGGTDTLANIQDVTGSKNNDTIVGSAADNNLYGGLGNDSINGGAGNDWTGYFDATAGVSVNLSTGVVTGGGGNDTLAGIENASGSGFNDTITGTSGDNALRGEAGNDTIDGGLGNDYITGGSGNDSLIGNTGIDTVDYYYSDASAGVNVNLATGAVTGGGGTDTISGFENVNATDFNDTITGDLNANFLQGEGGNDSISAGAGDDTVDGGRGGGTTDTIDGGAGTDTAIAIGAHTNYTVTVIGTDTLLQSVADDQAMVLRNVEFVQFGDVKLSIGDIVGGAITGDQSFTGGSGNDLLVGGSGNDTFSGLAGNDTLIGNDGNDLFFGGAGADSIVGGNGIDTVNYNEAGTTAGVVANLLTGAVSGGSGVDTLAGIENVQGSNFADSITGSAADNNLFGNGGNDTLLGGDGNDWLAGGAGNDSLIGGNGLDTADYSDATAGIAVTLVAGAGAVSGGGGTDALSGIENINGSNFNDTITGDANGNVIGGEGGNDSLAGGAGYDTVNYGPAAAGVNVNLATGVVTGGAGNDTISGFEAVNGSAFNDTLTGDANDNSFTPGAGDDFVNGGAGNADNVVYWDATAAVNVNLGTGVVTGGSGNDTLAGIENLTGSAYDDTIVGSSAGNFIDGGAGNDSLDGGAGFDTVGLGSATSAVYANLANGSVTGGAGIDTITGFEGVNGSAFNDTLVGDGNNNSFVGGQGNDSIDGAGGGADVAAYWDATAGVTANLATGAVTGGAGNDTLSNIENLTGSAFNDSLTGNGLSNALVGDAGNDTLDGGSGNDFLRGGAGNDSIIGGTGIDTADYADATAGVTLTLVSGAASVTGGGGADVLSGIENINGGAFNDSIGGDAGSNYLFGGAGNDTLLGGAGRDTLEGGAGNDSMDGGAITDRVNYTDLNFVNYANSTAGVNVNLGTGIAQDGMGGNDTLVNIDFVTGSAFNDTLTGSSTANLFEQFEGGAGDDTINGGAIDPITQMNANRVTYVNAGSAVTVNLATGIATGSTTGTDTLININHVQGSNYGDSLVGSDNAVLSEQFEGRGGDDTIDGAGGLDLVRYDSATTGVNVDLVNDTASDGLGGTDTLANIEGVRGSNFADTITGGNAANGSGALDGFEWFIGNGGNDTIDGGAGYDRVDYTTSTSGANVTLGGTGTGTAQDGLGGTDTLINIEGVRGSAFNDTLTGSDSAAFESFDGREGNDTIDGKGGIDRIDYKGGPAAVNVNLATGTASDGWGGTDTLANIENVRAGAFNDTITGSAVANFLEGLGGNDSIAAGDGDDTIDAGSGVDTVDGGNGNDTLRLAGLQGDYVVTRTATDTILTNGVTQENVTVRNVENFQFIDGTKSLSDVQGNSLSAFADNYVGTAGNDSIDGLAGDDTLNGLGGNDTLIGGTGNDSLIGGTGDDLFVLDNPNDIVVENATEGTDTANLAFTLAGTYTMAANLENATVTAASTIAVNVVGNALDNLIVGNAAANALTGGAGNDTLDGGAGIDALAGGAGNDTYVLDLATDVVNETAVGSGGTDTVKLMFAAAGSYTLAAGVENAFIGNGIAVTITGNELDNVITGNAANNSLVGGTGNDTLAGGTATGTGDTLDGGAGTDTVNMLAAFSSNYVVTRLTSTDTKIANAVTGEVVVLRGVESVHFADDTTKTMVDLWGNVPSTLDDSLVGTSGNDSIDGLAGNDTIYGLDGNDTLVGNTGNDRLIGGTGDDTYVVDVAADVIVENASEGYDTVNVAFTTAGVFNMATNADNVEAAVITAGATIGAGIIGNSLNNYLQGNAAANSLVGGDGSDMIDGGLGTDTMVGGAGNDIYYVNTTTDVINETVAGSSGYDVEIIVTSAAATYTLATNVEAGTLASSDPNGVNITGNASANNLGGSTGNNILLGLDGNDTITGGGGTDTIDGGTGTDTLVLSGVQSDYVITRPTATTTVFTKTGVQVTASNIELVQFDNGTFDYNTVVAQIGSVGNDTMTGTSGDDTLDGGLGNDSVQGLGGNDTLFGSAGNDTLVGGADSDVLDGGDGSDVYLYNQGDGDDLIVQNDTVSTDIDVLRLTQSGLTSNDVTFTRGFYSYDDLVVNVHQGSGETATIDEIVVVGFFANDAVNPASIDQVVIQATGALTPLATFTAAQIATAALSTGNGTDVWVGYNSADSITGSGGDDWISAGAGNDSVNGGGGNDTIFGGAGNDSLFGGAGDNIIIGGAGNDTLTGGGGDDTMSGGAGSDVYGFNPTAGHDVIREALPPLTPDQLSSGIGPMYVVGDGDAPLSSDVDVLFMNNMAVTDVIATRNGDNLVLTVQSTGASETVQDYFANGVSTIEKVVFSSSGTTWTSTQIHAKVLVPTDGNDSIVGYLGADKLSGGNGNDVLDGREGNDTLTGGVGNDTLTGGLGADRFVLDQPPAGLTVDTITDFTSGVDTIVLKGSVFTGLGAVGTRIGLSVNLLYNADTGELTYDADGAGGADGVVVAILGTTTHPDVGNDFIIG